MTLEKKFQEILLKKYETKLKEILNSIDKDASMEIVGSYRRGSKSSGDIDVILTHKDNKQHIFVKFLNIVKDNKIIKEFLLEVLIKVLQ